MLVWCEGMPEWVPIAEIPDLQPYVRHAAAARSVAPPAGIGVPRLQPAGVGPAAAGGSVAPLAQAFPPPPPAAPAAAGRLKFLAISTIILGSLGLLICPFSVGLNLAGPLPDLNALDSGGDIDLERIRVPRALVFGCLLLASLPMLIGGIGLLKRKRWAPLLLIISSAVCIMAHLAGLSIDIGFFFLPVLRQAGFDALPEANGAFIGSLVGAALSMVFAVAWHITSLLLVNSAAVRQHLK